MANPYGIEQVDVPGILAAYDTGRQRRVEMMLRQRQMEREDLQLDREHSLHAAYAKIRPPGSGGSAAVSAYGAASTAPAGPAGAATAPATPVSAPPTAPALASGPIAAPTAPLTAPTLPGAPAAPGTVPATWSEANQGVVSQLMTIDPPQAAQLSQTFRQMDDSKLAEVKRRNDAIAHVALGLKSLPEAERAAELQRRAASDLIPYGIDPASLTSADLTDRGLDQHIGEARDVEAIIKDARPDLMAVHHGEDVIDKDHPEKGALYSAPADFQHFVVHNADGSDTPYAVDPKTGRSFQLRDYGPPGAGGAATGQSGPAPAAVVDGKLDPHAFFRDFVGPHEGGLNPHDANGAPTNHGINATANPGVDIQNLSMDGAAQIFADKYFKASGAADLPPALAAVHADTAFINPSRAKQILQQSGGDPSKYMSLREAWMNNLVKGNPTKYGPYEKAWANRNRDLRQYAFQAGGGASDATSGGAGTPITGAPMPHDAGDDDSAKYIGGQVALGAPMPAFGMGKEAAAMRRAVYREAVQQWKAMGITPGEANVIAAQNKSGLAELGRIATIKANVQTAENTANSNASQVLSLLGSTGTTGSPIFNSWQQAGRRATGDSKVSAFDVAVKTLATEYARVMSGGGNAPLSDAARHEADALIHTSMTPDQFRSAIRQMKVDMANRTAGIEQERQATLDQIRTGGRAAPSAPAAPSAVGIPTLTPDQARHAAPGTVFRTTDGRTMRKQ